MEKIVKYETVLILDFKKLIWDRIRIDHFVILNKSKIIIKDKVHVSSFVQIYANKNVEIGNAGLSSGVKIYTSSEVYSLSKEMGPLQKNKNKIKKVEIGNYAIVGPNF